MGLLPSLARRGPSRPRLTGADLARAARGVQVTPETVAQFRAARAFLYAEWLGASIMVASFTLLFLLGVRPGVQVPAVLAATLSLFVLGTAVFWGAHSSYKRVGFPWAKRWDTTAIVVAGSGAMFWALFVLLEVLVLLGIPVGAP